MDGNHGDPQWLINDTKNLGLRICTCCGTVHLRVGPTTLSFSREAFQKTSQFLSETAARMKEDLEGGDDRPLELAPALPFVLSAVGKTPQ